MNTLKSNRRRSVSKIGEIDFKDAVAKSMSTLSRQDGAHRLTVNTTIEGLIPFHSDREMIDILFINILSNAIKFRHPHEARPKCDIHVDLNTEEAILSFRDNGIGIDKEYLGKVFDMFFCVPGAKTDGSGLGLFAAKEAVKKIKGNIKVDSIKGTGTVFSVVLPNLMDNDMKRKFNKLIENSK
jgi:signal transduction histidine kinase